MKIDDWDLKEISRNSITDHDKFGRSFDIAEFDLTHEPTGLVFRKTFFLYKPYSEPDFENYLKFVVKAMNQLTLSN